MKYVRAPNPRFQGDTALAVNWKSFGRRITLGDVRRSGIYVEYICGCCLSIRAFDPRQLPFGNLQLVAAMHRRMRCTFCGGAGASSMTRPTSVGPQALTSNSRGNAP